MIQLALGFIVGGIALMPVSSPVWYDYSPKVAVEAPKPPQTDALSVVEEEVVVKPPDWLSYCVEGLRYFGVRLPPRPAHAYLFEPNTPPFVGAVALFDYDGVRHAALVTGIYGNYFTVKETNYKKGKYTERTIAWSDYRLLGFYTLQPV